MKAVIMLLLVLIGFEVAGQNGAGSTAPRDSTKPARVGAGSARGNQRGADTAAAHAVRDGAIDSVGGVGANGNNNGVNGTAGTTITGGNDTTFNANSVSQGGVTTNTGAVDRSGQGQFGQTNWGGSRSTVGESQWTVPPPITASFNKDFPASNSTTWTRNKVDTTVFSARAKTGAQWVRTSYNTSGQRLDQRTEYPVIQAPRPVSVYLAKQPANFRVTAIYKLQVQGKPEVYEIETLAGKKIYLNNEGMEVKY